MERSLKGFSLETESEGLNEVDCSEGLIIHVH